KMPETTTTTETPSPGQQDSSSQATTPQQPFELPVLALQNTTLFPETVVPLAVGRPRSVAAVEAALGTPEKLLACITVRPDPPNASGDQRPHSLSTIRP